MIPKPFSRVAIAIGEPVIVPKSAGKDEMENCRVKMEQAILELMTVASDALATPQR